MRILLIDPPYDYKEFGGARQNFKGVLNKILSLGLAYLAAVAETKKHTVKIIDCTIDSAGKELLKAAKSFNPQIIGITATTPTFSNAVLIAYRLRKILPEAVFICGGAHPTASPRETLDTGVFDFLVLGEGEKTFLELVSYLESNQQVPCEDIDGIAFKKDGKFISTRPRPRIEDLDSLPFPARHLFPPLAAYRPTPASYKKLPLAAIITSRGCPSRCTFCDRAVFGEKFRQRSADNVMAEIEEVMHRYAAKEIRFFDDTFTLDPVFIEGICKKMQKLRQHIPWTCLTRVTAVNFDMLKMMRDAGCWQVLFGLESGDENILKYLGKGNTVEQNRRAVFWAKEAGLSVRADFLVGSPWETKESLEKTLTFAKSLPLDFAHFNKFVPLPGTDIYKDLAFRGYKIVFDRGSYINNHSDFVYVPEEVDKFEYARFLDKSYKEFYLRPGYILRKLLSIRSFKEFAGQVKGLSSILSL